VLLVAPALPTLAVLLLMFCDHCHLPQNSIIMMLGVAGNALDMRGGDRDEDVVNDVPLAGVPVDDDSMFLYQQGQSPLARCRAW
jgi:hypothetical protein